MSDFDPKTDPFSQVIILLMEFFKGDESKAFEWIDTENLLLGNIKPIEFIVSGRSEKLLKFIKTMIDENKRTKEWGGSDV